MKHILLFTLILCLAGCETLKPKQYAWQKKGATSQDFYIDSGQCKAQGASVPGMPLMQVAIVYTNCMAGKGWYQVEVNQ